MWKKDEYGSIYTETIPDGWSVAVWSDFFLNDRFLVNLPFLEYNRINERYYGHRTKDYRSNKDFQMIVFAGLIFVQKKS